MNAYEQQVDLVLQIFVNSTAATIHFDITTLMGTYVID